MALVFTGRESEREKTEKLNALASAVTRWEKMAVGPGLELRNHSGGMLLNVKHQPGKRRGGSAAEDNTDVKTLTAVQATQDTDTYDSETDSEDWVAISYIHDIEYDVNTGKLQYRVRTAKVKALAVTAESDPIEITTAEICF